MSAPGTPKASQAAITAVQEALGCARGTGWNQQSSCRHPYHPPQWTERGCPVAVAAADAAAPHNAAQAKVEVLREFADHDLHGLIPYSEISNHWYHMGLGDAQAECREWADRIEAGQ